MLSYTKSFLFYFFKGEVFFFSWLHLVFVAVSGLSLAALSRGLLFLVGHGRLL